MIFLEDFQLLGTRAYTTHTCKVGLIYFLHTCVCPEHVSRNVDWFEHVSRWTEIFPGTCGQVIHVS